MADNSDAGEYSDLGDAFFQMGKTDNLRIVNHNEKDYEPFQKFQESLEKMYEDVEKDRARNERLTNVRKWDARQTDIWRTARLSNVRDRDAVEKVTAIVKSRRPRGIFVRGDVQSGKSFFALATIRALIGLGFASPSQVYQSSEDRLMDYLRGGFDGFKMGNEVFLNRWRIYLIEDVGAKLTYNDNQVALLERFLDHASRNGVVVIFTSNGSASAFKQKLNDVAASRLDYLFEGHIITMNPPKLDAPVVLDEMSEVERDELRLIQEAPPYPYKRSSTADRVRRRKN